jgi:hypothetical protein
MTPGASPRVNRTSVKLKRRNNVGKWPIKPVVPENRHKVFAYYVAKDLRMAADASHGLMLWDAKSNRTLNNMINLLAKDKKVLAYFSPENILYIAHVCGPQPGVGKVRQTVLADVRKEAPPGESAGRRAPRSSVRLADCIKPPQMPRGFVF